MRDIWKYLDNCHHKAANTHHQWSCSIDMKETFQQRAKQCHSEHIFSAQKVNQVANLP